MEFTSITNTSTRLQLDKRDCGTVFPDALAALIYFQESVLTDPTIIEQLHSDNAINISLLAKLNNERTIMLHFIAFTW